MRVAGGRFLPAECRVRVAGRPLALLVAERHDVWHSAEGGLDTGLIRVMTFTFEVLRIDESHHTDQPNGRG